MNKTIRIISPAPQYRPPEVTAKTTKRQLRDMLSLALDEINRRGAVSMRMDRENAMEFLGACDRFTEYYPGRMSLTIDIGAMRMEIDGIPDKSVRIIYATPAPPAAVQ